MRPARLSTRLSIAALALALLLQPTPLLAQPECPPAADPPALVGASPDPRVDALPVIFHYRPWTVPAEQLIAETLERVHQQLSEVQAPPCVAERLRSTGDRVTLLSPYEFLVASAHHAQPARRDALLARYRDDPRQALRELDTLWPSPRAELLLKTEAFFDLENRQVLVNLGVVDAAMAPNVVAHELWHALAEVRLEQGPDGSLRRENGFSIDGRAPHQATWRPLNDELPGGVTAYLMNEAVAVELEADATGREHPLLRPELTRARSLLHELFASAGRDEVLRLYLASRADELRVLAAQAVLSARP